MGFEDFNYGNSNKYILVDPNFAEDDYIHEPELSSVGMSVEDMQA